MNAPARTFPTVAASQLAAMDYSLAAIERGRAERAGVTYIGSRFSPAERAAITERALREIVNPDRAPAESFPASQKRFAREVLTAMAKDRVHPRFQIVRRSVRMALAMKRLDAARAYRMSAAKANGRGA